MTDLRELGLPMDDEGHVDGYLVGKAAAIADWQHRKEEREFAKLVNRLRARNWARALRAEDSERSRRFRERMAAWAREYAKTPKGQAQRLRAKEARRNRYRRNAPVLTCEACGAQWCRVPWVRGLAVHRRFCSERCRQRARYRARVGATSYGRTTAAILAAIGSKWTRHKDVVARAAVPRGSVSATLRRLISERKVDVRRVGRVNEYRVRGQAGEVAA